jgi:hypothetical protein
VVVIDRGCRGLSRPRYHRHTADEKHTADGDPAFRAGGAEVLWRGVLWMLVLVAISAPWFNIPVDNADSAGMQAHLHGLFETRDLLYDDEYAALQMSPLFAFVTERGVVSNHWPAGASFVQAPGWLLGRLAGATLVGDGVSERAATWTLPLLGLRVWALLLLAWLVVRVHGWLTVLVGSRTAVLATLGFAIGTPLLYYATESPLRPHLWGAAVVAVLSMRWFDAIGRTAENPERARADWRAPLELALYAGLATAIRPQLAMLALLVAHERWCASTGLSPSARVRLLVVHGFPSALVFAVWPALVVRMQLWMYGGMADYGGVVRHHVRAFLLSTHHGALVWCPVLVLGLLGLAIGLVQRRRGAALLLAIFAAQIWIDAGTREIEPYTVLGTRTWTGGTSFGPRKLLDVMPLLLPGVVWLAQWLDGQAAYERAKWRRRLFGATVLAMVPTVLLLAAAFIDPAVCSMILDGERLSLVLSLGFDLDNWTMAWASRALPLRVTLRVAAFVGLPIAVFWLLGLSNRRARVWLWWWGVLLALGIAANFWIAQLERRSDALLEDDPQRMDAAAARMHPWHEATVAEIPRHHAQLRARLGPEAAD